MKQTDEIGYLHKEILIKRTTIDKRKTMSLDGVGKVVNVIPLGDNGLLRIKFTSIVITVPFN